MRTSPAAIAGVSGLEEHTGQELHELAPDDARLPAARGVAAVIPRAYLREAADGLLRITAPTLQHAERLCEGEPFGNQPSAATCTAFLIDDNLVATAGHCFKHALDCQNYWFVFGYAYAAAGAALRIAAADAYECVRARVQENDPKKTDTLRDFAIIELTRPVRARPVLPVRAAALREREAVAVVSAARGVPLKIDLRARVLETRSAAGDYFILQSDTYRGSSGAPVLDAAGSVLGLFVRGGNDYVLDKRSACYRATAGSADRSSGQGADFAKAGSSGPAEPSALMQRTQPMKQRVPEQASYLRPALDALCSMNYPSPRLCGTMPRCGDHICSPDETHASCANDCDERALRP